MMESLLEWLKGEAGAGWVMGLLGLLWGLISWRKSGRPPRVIIQELERIRLLDIIPSQREKLSVFYTDSDGTRDVQELEQRKLVIYNNGAVDILEELQFTLTFVEEGSEESDQDGKKQCFCNLWSFVDQMSFDGKSCTATSVLDNDKGVAIGDRIRIPYLNSYPVHKHYVTAHVISDRTIELELAERAGKGWSARFISICDIEKMRRRVSKLLPWVFFLVMVLALVPLGTEALPRPGADTLLWSKNLTPDRIEEGVRKYEKRLEHLSRLRPIERIFYLFS